MSEFANILLFCDAITPQSALLEQAVALAHASQAVLTVCAVVDIDATEQLTVATMVAPSALIDIAVAVQRKQLEESIKVIIGDATTLKIKILVGKPFVEITRQVLRENHDLVIKNVESDNNLRSRFFGNTDMNLLRNCPCPVWLIKGTGKQPMRRILAAVDQDPDDPVKDNLNRQILTLATTMAAAQASELHVVHAWRLFGESYLRSPGAGLSHAEVDEMAVKVGKKCEHWLEKLVRPFAIRSNNKTGDPNEPQRHVIKGDPREVVSSKARLLDVDLVVMGTVARTGIKGFIMGNTAESILTQLDCSVLTVKPSGFISPITLDT